ncbi:MAG: ferric reductase-like transmembrane domain-containing protein [Rhodobacteraceae bacterium]|nr:ferric reductase-like transmembrane domain-containing protein [Paracoccaceae bacterium]
MLGLPVPLLLGVLVPTALIFLGGGNTSLQSLVALSAGASAFTLMGLNLFLATRPKYVERWFGGLDRLYVSHKWIGILVLPLILFHKNVGMLDIEGQIAATGLAKTSVDVAELVFIPLLVLLLASWLKKIPFGSKIPGLKRFRGDLIPYHWWRWSHRALGVLFLGIVFHQLFVKVPFNMNALAAQYLNFWAIVGAVSFVYTQFLAPMRPRAYIISKVEKHPAATIIDAEPVRSFRKIKPGRFAVISIARRGLREPHPFTVSRFGEDGSIQFSIRGLGDYTRRVRDLVEVGDKMTVEGGYGAFDYRRGPDRQVWLAGGIGVTPFLTFADSLTAEDTRRFQMVYCVNKPEEAVGLDRFRAAEARCPGFKFRLYVSKEEGRFSAEKLTELVPFEMKDAGLWFCGPAPMREAVLKDLKASGNRPKSVHFEEFEFR